MREIFDFNKKWAFRKGENEIPTEVPVLWDFVNLPHTWNAIDGQDGGGDYYRGTGTYVKRLEKAELPKSDRYYLEIGGANSSADVYVNGKKVTHHDGGYSLFRVDITEFLEEDNLFVIKVDNSKNDTVYPQFADFTFYGGVYRAVRIICVSEEHIDLTYFGGDGVMVTPAVKLQNAEVDVEVFVKNKSEKSKIRYTVYDKAGNKVTETEGAEKATLPIENVRLWRGRLDPYLYTLVVEIVKGEKTLDAVSVNFGCRSFSVDSERGFILNGEEYALHGVSRHQDRLGIGNALLPSHHREDIDLIREIGATSIRLAHYQHDRYFYELCDEYGFVVWAEIPYISENMPAARENALSQMRELVIQNYNHPSIAFWGLSNEITMRGERDADLIETHKMLNNLCHELDKTRLTTIAVVSPCPIDAEYLKIPDLVAYNHYFGWYGGEAEMNGPWFDNFHKENPDIPIACSEYGAEALNWHTSTPVQGDYTEEYQAWYHEQLILQLYQRKYLWATYVWNMFDFGADARSEGGENGQNHKGLVTFDRQYKKDSFYAYKAWLSDKPFVHIAGKRYVDRVEEVTRVTVYSNLPEVELFQNGKSVGKQRSENHFFYFEVKNEGESHLEARAEDNVDSTVIRKVEKFNEKYLMREKGALLNWYDITEKEGRLSLKSKISDILATEKGKQLFAKIFENMSKPGASGFEMNDAVMSMMGSFTLLRFSSMASSMGLEFSKEELLRINKELNQIEKA